MYIYISRWLCLEEALVNALSCSLFCASVALSGFKIVVVSSPTNLIPDEVRNPLCSRGRILGGEFRLNPAADIEREVSELCPNKKSQISILRVDKFFLHRGIAAQSQVTAGHSSVGKGRCPKLMQRRRIKTAVGKVLQYKLFEQKLFNVDMLSTHRSSLKLNTRAELLVCYNYVIEV